MAVYPENVVCTFLNIWSAEFGSKCVSSQKLLRLAQNNNKVMQALTHLCQKGSSDLCTRSIGWMLLKLPDNIGSLPYTIRDGARTGDSRTYILERL